MKAPDAIVVLSGGIKQIAGRWVSTDLTDNDDTQGAPGASLRVAAATILSKRYPSARIIASGGAGYDVPEDAPKNRPFLCEILKAELIAADVPDERIEIESASNTTYQQLQQLEILIRHRSFRSVVIVSSRWHLPRIETMLTIKFPALRASVRLVSAEEVLIEADQARWGPAIAKAYASAFMAERMANENRGISQIKNGTYQFR